MKRFTGADAAVWGIWLVVLVSCWQSCVGYSAEVLVPRNLSFSEAKYEGNINRDPYLGIDNEHEKFQYFTRLRWDFDLLCIEGESACLFWNNKIDAKTTTQQYRSVEWSFNFGLAFKRIDLFYEHHSRHGLDAKYEQGFPLENYYGFTWKILDNPRRRSMD
jgi:hypothetical protein